MYIHLNKGAQLLKNLRAISQFQALEG